MTTPRRCRTTDCYSRLRLITAAMRAVPSIAEREIPSGLLMHLLVAIDEKTFAHSLRAAMADEGGK